MADTTPNFYILHGDDGIALDEAVKKLRESMGDDPNVDLNIDEFEGEETTVPAVLNAVKSFPFLSDKRLVFVKGLLSWITRKGAGETGKKGVERLLEDLPNLPDYARLVFIEKSELPANSKLVKLAQKLPNGYEKAFTVPKDSTEWIIRRAKSEYQVEIEPQAAVALASVTGADLRRADNELVKLVSYISGEDRPITELDVARLTPYLPETNIFNMIDALAGGDGKQALTLMHQSLNENPRDDGFGLFALIVRQFRLLLLTQEYLSAGGSTNNNDIAAGIGIRSGWQAGKLARQARAFTVEELEHIFKRLQQYDVDMKTGKINPRLALDLLVSSLAKK